MLDAKQRNLNYVNPFIKIDDNDFLLVLSSAHYSKLLVNKLRSLQPNDVL